MQQAIVNQEDNTAYFSIIISQTRFSAVEEEFENRRCKFFEGDTGESVKRCCLLAFLRWKLFEFGLVQRVAGGC